MSNNKQSSVEWLHHEFERIDKEFHVGTYEYNYAKNLALKIAKAMHKEEHGKTWDKSLDNLKARGMMGFWTYTDFDDYYNETFNTHEKNNKN